jgi:hypothetical protein
MLMAPSNRRLHQAVNRSLQIIAVNILVASLFLNMLNVRANACNGLPPECAVCKMKYSKPSQPLIAGIPIAETIRSKLVSHPANGPNQLALHCGGLSVL